MDPAVALAISLLSALEVRAQQEQPPTQQPARVEEHVEVVGVTPIHGIGIPTLRVPANVQVFTHGQIRTSLDVPTLLAHRAASVQAAEAQAGTFQPDLHFRGFVVSPLLGASEGLAVYQDGVRINDPFGDTVQWDVLPAAAIASINLMPGSNPLFGLNALGGALSIRTKDGFDFPGHRALLTTGSFGRHHLDIETGAHGEAFGYFVAGSLTDEAGWRHFSPSAIRRVFGDLAWRGRMSAVHVSSTLASNDLTGNGAAPIDLLERDRAAVFTYPDRTANDVALLTVRGRRAGQQRLFQGVAYYRVSRTGTHSGDAAGDDSGDGCHEPGAIGGVNNISDTRGRAAGLTGQVTHIRPLFGRDNHFVFGAGIDLARTKFGFAAELAHLTPDRGTRGTGIFLEEAFVDVHSRVATGSAFVTDTWSPSGALSLSASARFNWTALRLRDQIGTALTGDHRFQRINPAAGITYQMRPWLNAFGSYMQSSRIPTPVELTCADPEDPCRLPNAFVSDPPLNQIVARTWETGLRSAQKHLRWALAAFTTTARNDIIFVSSGPRRGEGHFENVARTVRSGAEAHVEHEITPHLSVSGAYTFQRATFGTELRVVSAFHPDAREAEIDVESGDRLPTVPSHVAKFGCAAGFSDRLNVSVNVRAQSGHVLRGDEANLLSQVPGFAVVNALGRLRLTKRLAIVLQAHNLFDAGFYTFGVLGDAELLLGEAFDSPRFYSPGAPRAAWLGVDVRF